MLHAAPIVASAIVLHALAFIIWDVGTRTPAQLVRDVVAGARALRSVVRGLTRFFAGFVFVMAGGLFLLDLPVVDLRREFATLEIGAILSGLVVEALLGESLRVRWWGRSRA